MNKTNYYKKVIAVQEVYVKYKQQGLTNRSIYTLHIENVFYISIRTLYEYLNVPAKFLLNKSNTKL